MTLILIRKTILDICHDPKNVDQILFFFKENNIDYAKKDLQSLLNRLTHENKLIVFKDLADMRIAYYKS